MYCDLSLVYNLIQLNHLRTACLLTMIDKNWSITPNKPKAIMLAKRQLSELVYDAVQLEGINFTLPEIQT